MAARAVEMEFVSALVCVTTGFEYGVPDARRIKVRTSIAMRTSYRRYPTST